MGFPRTPFLTVAENLPLYRQPPEQPHQVGLLLFALGYLLTRKRVKVFLDRYLIRYFVLCKLISDILRNYFLVPPYCIHIVAFAPKCRFPYLYFRFACRSNIISELFPLRYPINCDTLYLDGILTSIWIWSGQVSASIISTPLYSHSFLRMLPISARICPYICLSPIFWCKYYVLFTVPACMCKTIYFLFLLCSKHGYSSSATFLAIGKPASIVAWEVYLFPLIGLAFFIPRA